MLTEIIIIRFNCPEFEEDCIDSVQEYTKSPYTLTIYDNYEKKEPLGVVWNRLIKKSNAEYICLLNSDTLVEENWLKNILKGFKFDDIGAVGPSTNRCATIQNRGRSKGYKILQFNPDNGNWLGGFCLVFKKKVWEDIGGFDESFGFYGQETNFLWKMCQRGYKMVWAKGVFVWHYGGASIKKADKLGELNEEKEREEGRQKFKDSLNDEGQE